MKQIALKREQIFTGPLILVNKAHPIRRTIRQQELRTVGRGIRLQREAALQLKLLLENQESIVSVSGFRSHREQVNGKTALMLAATGSRSLCIAIP